MKKTTAEDILKNIIPLLILYLEDLSEIKDVPEKQFAYGEKIAYTECLQRIAEWEKASLYGLNNEIKKKYPLY